MVDDPDGDDLIVAVNHYVTLDRASSLMEQDIEESPKKRGAFMKYRHLLPPKVWNDDPDWYDVGSPDKPATKWHIAALALAFDMKDRLMMLSYRHGVALNG